MVKTFEEASQAAERFVGGGASIEVRLGHDGLIDINWPESMSYKDREKRAELVRLVREALPAEHRHREVFIS